MASPQAEETPLRKTRGRSHTDNSAKKKMTRSTATTPPAPIPHDRA